VYAAAKAGAINFTKTMALELAPYGVRMNAIAPDMCITEGLESMNSPAEIERAARMIPMGRAATPADIAGVAIFLASDLSRYMTGETLHVDGGTHAAGGWYRNPDGGRYILGPP
jgi:NAD(P)-dependent dehydrogenase (short-subunit alcohol dehydrogenase family)